MTKRTTQTELSFEPKAKRSKLTQVSQPFLVIGENCIYFKSSSAGNTHKLSNFFACTISVGEDALTPEVREALPHFAQHITRYASENDGSPAVYSCSEALWQSMRVLDYDVFTRFLANGDLGPAAPRPGHFAPFFPLSTNLKAKHTHWMAKSNVGIIPKLASNPKHHRRAKIDPEAFLSDVGLKPAMLQSVWLWLLRLKYTQNPDLRRILESTAPLTLIETERKAKTNPAAAFWGGIVADGRLYGTNQMGIYMTLIRNQLITEA